MITVKPVAFNVWEWNKEIKESERHLRGWYPFYFLNGIMRNSAIQGYNTAPLYPSSDEAMKAYSEPNNRVAPDWFSKKEMEEWKPGDVLDKENGEWGLLKDGHRMGHA